MGPVTTAPSGPDLRRSIWLLAFSTEKVVREAETLALSCDSSVFVPLPVSFRVLFMKHEFPVDLLC